MIESSKIVCALLSIVLVTSCGAQISPNSGKNLTAQEDFCQGPDVKKISRPIHPDDPTSEAFEYRYRHINGSGSSDLTMFFLKGGPGQIGIDGGGIPAGFEDVDFVQIDLRGIGCNVPTFKIEPKRFFSSETFAKDLLAVVHDVAPKRYAIYGISYGTLLATVTAAMAAAEHSPGPDFLVLEGVLGRAFKLGEQEEAFIKEWNTTKLGLAPGVMEVLETEREPLGFSPEVWAAWIGENLFSGYVPGVPGYEEFTRGNPLVLMLNKIVGSAEDRGILQEDLQSQADILHTETPENLRQLQRWVSCREIYFGDRKATFERGALVFGEDVGDCKDVPLSNAFDSGKWSVNVPIFYFQGENDPATPMANARYHFESQVHAPRTFVTIEKGGHNALVGNLSDCFAEVWRTLVRADSPLESALSECLLKTTVERKAAL